MRFNAIETMPMKRQSGYATLTIAVLLLALLVLVTLYTARVKSLEQRIMRNHIASEEAEMVAEAALDQTVMLLNANKSDLNTTYTGTVGGATFTATLTNTHYPDTPRGDVDIVDVEIVANSADGSATKTIHQKVAILPVVREAPDTPVAIRGSINVSGSFQIVANPNGGGDGVPLSLWTRDDVDINGNGTTCGQQEFDSGNCESQAFSERGDHGVDILDNDPNFPPDLLDYLFGVKEENWEQLRSMAQVITDCGSLGPDSTGLFWITGTCDIGSGPIGTPEDPLALIVHDGDFKMNGNIVFYGMVFQFKTPGNLNEYEITLNGGAFVEGAIMASEQPKLSNGNLTVRYNQEVLTNVVSNDAFRSVFRVGGSWRDF